MSDLLARLRAYAAANPTDVQVVRETIQVSAEIDAYAALAQLRRKWARRQDAVRRAVRAELPTRPAWYPTVGRDEPQRAPSRTLRGFPIPQLEEEPFLLTRRVTSARTR